MVFQLSRFICGNGWGVKKNTFFPWCFLTVVFFILYPLQILVSLHESDERLLYTLPRAELSSDKNKAIVSPYSSFQPFLLILSDIWVILTSVNKNKL